MVIGVTTGPAGDSAWWGLLIIAGAGAVGGLFNALLSDNGFALPTRDERTGVLRIGFLGNVMIGALAGAVTWGLYGPAKDVVLYGPSGTGALVYNISLSSLIGAVLAGVGGARVITSEVDKRFLQKAAGDAAASNADPEKAVAIATASPTAAFDLATKLPKPKA
jgi:hypothetical protein